MILLLIACSATPVERVEPTFVTITLNGGATGSLESPLPFSADPTTYSITVTTQDKAGAEYPFNGDLTLSVRPGKFSEDPLISLNDGLWTGDVQFEDAFGPTRIWATDEGDRDEDSARLPTYSVGVSPEIWFAFPTIAEMQSTDDPETNQLEGEYAELRISDRQVVVTARDAAGFWVADLADATGSGNTLYVYTFNRPDDDVAVGAQLSALNGINSEYLASTQFNWPTVKAADNTLAVPDAVELTACDDADLELLEGARVVATNGEIPDTFLPGSEAYLDYEEYGQWPLSVGGCEFAVESGVTAQNFIPTELAGQTIPEVSGMLKQIFSSWVIVVVDEADIVAGPPAPVSRTTPPPRIARPSLSESP